MSKYFTQAFFSNLGLQTISTRNAFFSEKPEEASRIEKLLIDAVTKVSLECKAIIDPWTEKVQDLKRQHTEKKIAESRAKQAANLEAAKKYEEKIKEEAIESYKASTVSVVDSYLSGLEKKNIASPIPSSQKLVTQAMRVPKAKIYDISSSDDEDFTLADCVESEDNRVIELGTQLAALRQKLAQVMVENQQLIRKNKTLENEKMSLEYKLNELDAHWEEKFHKRAIKYNSMRSELEELKLIIEEFTDRTHKRIKRSEN